MIENPHAFLVTFALVLCTAAITTVLFQRLKQPVILGYLVAGMLVGPHVTLLPFVADQHTIEILAELGVILLLFGIGLEFSLRRLMRIGGAAGITGVIAVSLTFWLGNVTASLLGWNSTEAIFAGAATAVSSTTIIGKAFSDRGIKGKLRDLVFGVLVVEDLFSVLMLAILAPIAAGESASAGEVLWSAFRLFCFLAIGLVIGLLVIPRLIRWVIARGSNEVTIVSALGLAFAGAVIASHFDYSVALGAFLAGSLIAESGEGKHVEELILPIRDLFGAVFFISVGMLIEPSVIQQHWNAVAVFSAVVVVGMIVAISIGAFLAGSGVRLSLQAAMSMAQIGEFSFIIAGLGATSTLVGSQLYPVMVAVSAVTTLLTPWLIHVSPVVASYVDRKLPRPMQTYAALYATWVDNLRAAPRQRSMGQRVRAKARWLLIDAAVVAAIVIGVSLKYSLVIPLLAGVPLVQRIAPATTGILLALLLAAPFLFGMFRMASGMALMLAHVALPQSGRLDRAAAPRSSLVITIEIVILLVIGLPLLALTQPFLPPLRGGLVLGLLLFLLLILVWRSARNLDGHVRAGAEALLAVVGSTLPPVQFTEEMPVPIAPLPDKLTSMTQMLPGMGIPERVVIAEGHYAAGKTLAALGVRGRTGATILGITRAGVAIPAPSKVERLEVGDILVLVGTGEDVAAARELLERG